MFAWLKRRMYPTVSIVQGRAIALDDAIPSGFVRECQEVVSISKLIKGDIYLVKKDFGVTLDFSSRIPKSIQQRFRNVWNIHRTHYRG